MTDSPTGAADIPHLERLDEAGVDAIHRASMHVLENVGIQVNHERARELLVESGGEVHEDAVVTVPADVIVESVERAPSQFTLHARNPEKDVRVGEGGPVRAPGYGPPNVRTLADGRRRSTLSDYEALVKLAQLEDAIDCTGYSVCEPGDVDQSVKHLEMVGRSLTLTDQPVMGSTYGAERARECLEMVGIAVGDRDLREPYVAGLINTRPPRSFDAKMLGGLLTYAEHGQPPIVSSFTMAGASGPPDVGAALAQANAEALLGVALTQLVNPGTPVVYGTPVSNIDVRYGSLSIGSPESALFVSIGAQLGRYYDLPSRGGGALTDAKTVDYQSGAESMLLQAVADLSGVDFVLHAAGILESYKTISPEKFVLDCETLRYLDRFRQGPSLGEDGVALDRLERADPAGHFLDEESTPATARREFYLPGVLDKRSHGEWADAGAESALERGRERVESQLAAYERPPLEPDRERELAAYVEARTDGR